MNNQIKRQPNKSRFICM